MASAVASIDKLNDSKIGSPSTYNVGKLGLKRSYIFKAGSNQNVADIMKEYRKKWDQTDALLNNQSYDKCDK